VYVTNFMKMHKLVYEMYNDYMYTQTHTHKDRHNQVHNQPLLYG